MEALLGLSDTADCVTRVENLLGDLKTLEDKAQVWKLIVHSSYIHCLVNIQTVYLKYIFKMNYIYNNSISIVFLNEKNILKMFFT